MNQVRRLVALVAVVCLVFSCCTAFAAAMTQEEWNSHCKYKLSTAASVYESPDKNPGTKLSAGTYIVVQGSIEGWKYIKYYKSGETYLGWVKESTVVTSTGEALATTKPAESTTGSAPANTGAQGAVSLPAQGIADAVMQAESAMYQTPSAQGTQVAVLPEGETVIVTGVGLSWCSVQAAAGSGYVPTQSLSFTGAAGDSPFAVAASSSAGKLTLREKADSSAKAVCSIPDGTYAIVLGEDGSFTHVLADGKEGYLNTHYLLFFKACEALETRAQVINPNNAGKEISVNMRSKEDTGATVVAQVKTGSTVLVLAENGSWSEIEYNGLHGYMQSKYLQAE